MNALTMATDGPRLMPVTKGDSVLKIEAMCKSAAVGLSGRREVWVHVLSNEALDWPRVQDMLGAGQAAMLDNLGAGRKLAYFPHSPTSDEREDHGYAVEDWWVWSAAK